LSRLNFIALRSIMKFSARDDSSEKMLRAQVLFLFSTEYKRIPA
jgi:hypothetical protein